MVEVSEFSQDWYHLEMPEAGSSKALAECSINLGSSVPDSYRKQA